MLKIFVIFVVGMNLIYMEYEVKMVQNAHTILCKADMASSLRVLRRRT